MVKMLHLGSYGTYSAQFYTILKQESSATICILCILYLKGQIKKFTSFLNFDLEKVKYVMDLNNKKFINCHICIL